MSEKYFQMLMELAQEKVSKEEGFRLLVQCGLLDEEGNLTLPEAAPYLTASPVNK